MAGSSEEVSSLLADPEIAALLEKRKQKLLTEGGDPTFAKAPTPLRPPGTALRPGAHAAQPAQGAQGSGFQPKAAVPSPQALRPPAKFPGATPAAGAWCGAKGAGKGMWACGANAAWACGGGCASGWGGASGSSGACNGQALRWGGAADAGCGAGPCGAGPCGAWGPAAKPGAAFRPAMCPYGGPCAGAGGQCAGTPMGNGAGCGMAQMGGAAQGIALIPKATGAGLVAAGATPTFAGYPTRPAFLEAKKQIEAQKQMEALAMKRGGPNMASPAVVMDESQARKFQASLRKKR